MTKIITLALLAVAMAFGQAGQAVNQTSGVPFDTVLKQYFYDGSNNVQYICLAPQNNQRTTVQRSGGSLTSIVVATNVGTVTTASAHGLYVGARVTITGATVDPDLNATYTVASVPSTTTYTIATSAVSDGTYTESTLQIATTYPLLTASRWAIEVFHYNAGGYVDGSYWANASIGYGLACTSRTSY